MCRIQSAKRLAGAVLTGCALAAATGCEQQPKKVLDVKAPGFSLEIERSQSGSETGVKIDAGKGDSGTSIDIQRSPDSGTTVDVNSDQPG